MVTSSGPRLLLKRLREVMAQPDTAQARLDRVVSLIAANMVAEVCSIYVMTTGNELELYATEGLLREAVHQSRLKVGEGLVGTIAATASMLNLADAQVHPAFKYLPETGEEAYKSFLGVPILRGGDTIGVLVVQNRTSRHYSEEEEEAIQITAMVLAEVIASGGLHEVAQAVEADIAHVRSHHIVGEALVDGIALGHAVLHQPRVVVTNYIAESVPEEQKRLEKAMASLRDDVDRLVEGSEFAPSSEYADVLETVRMFAHDQGWLRRIREAVDTGLTAEAAVERIQTDNRARMLRQTDPYLRERLHDLDDLANRLLRILAGKTSTAAKGELPQNAVLVARNMGAAELLDYDRAVLRGLILEEAGNNSHVAIVARALDLPTVTQAAGSVDLVDTGDAVIVDGATGEVHIRPSQEIEQAYAEKVRFYARRQETFRQIRDVPAVTRDGVRINIGINAGLVVDLPHLADSGADGIGLFRTELHFLLARKLPRLERQTRHYREILSGAEGRPVVFRTLDIGSDKVLPYLASRKEENPALGWRAMRVALDRPALLKLQLRALLIAAQETQLRVMFPMVSSVEEFRAAREILRQEAAHLSRRGYKLPKEIRVGSMLEVPSLLFELDKLLPLVDFVSVGSNDLIQYLFAADRGHPRLAGRYDALSPVVMRVLAKTEQACREANVPLSLCGEMAGRTVDALALIGLGYESISMAPAAVGPVRSMILALERNDLRRHMTGWIDSESQTIRHRLVEYAEANNIPL